LHNHDSQLYEGDRAASGARPRGTVRATGPASSRIGRSTALDVLWAPSTSLAASL